MQKVTAGKPWQDRGKAQHPWISRTAMPGLCDSQQAFPEIFTLKEQLYSFIRSKTNSIHPTYLASSANQPSILIISSRRPSRAASACITSQRDSTVKAGWQPKASTHGDG